MSYGEAGAGTHAWTLTEADSQPFFRQALEAGINFFDTANVYLRKLEEITGRALSWPRSPRRDRRCHQGSRTLAPGAKYPASPGRLLFQAMDDDSLQRLGMDYVDLYQIHRFDSETPVEETMEALHDLVKAGETRYLGASSMAAWQFAKMQ